MSTQYDVLVNFIQQGNLGATLGAPLAGLSSKVKDLHKDFSSSFLSVGSSLVSGVDSAIGKVGSAIVGTVETAAMVAGGAMTAVLGGAMKEGLAFAQYNEDLVNGLAGTMSMVGDIPLDKGLKQAAQSAENLRQLAIKLPGEFKDAANAFSFIMPTGLGHGVSFDRLENMAALGVGAAASLGINQSVAGHELAALLEGRATGRMPLFSKMLGADLSAKDFNKLSFDKRFEMIEKRFNKLGPAMNQFGGSWSGLTSAAKDQSRNVAKTFAQPLFGSIKGQLERGLEWFGKNEDQVHEWAVHLGNRVNDAFVSGVHAIEHWYPIVRTFGENLYNSLHSAFTRVEPFLDKFGRVAEKFMADPQALNKLAHVGSIMLAAKVGTSVASFGLGNASGIGDLLADAGMGAGELAVAAPIAVGGLLAAAIAAEGFVHALTDSTSIAHGAATAEAGMLADNTKKASKELVRLDQNTRQVRDLFGVLAGGVLVSATTQIGLWGSALNMQLDALGSFHRGMMSVTQWMLDHVKLRKDTPFPEDPRHKFAGGGAKLLVFPDVRRDLERQNERKIPQHTTNVHGGIHVHLEGSGDPARVAVAVEDLLRRKMMRPNGRRSNPMAQL